MLFNRHKTELPTPDQALKGQTEQWFTLAERHLVLDAPLVTPESEIPDGYEVAIFVGTTELKRTSVAVSAQTGTGGNKQSVTIMKTVSGLSGTFNVTMQHRRSSGSGTLYATRRDLDVLKFKKRA